MTDLEAVRCWAERKGIPLNADGSVPEHVILRYQKARAYQIRKTYARRASNNKRFPAKLITYRTPGATL